MTAARSSSTVRNGPGPKLTLAVYADMVVVYADMVVTHTELTKHLALTPYGFVTACAGRRLRRHSMMDENVLGRRADAGEAWCGS
jgi:hypothetical protein